MPLTLKPKRIKRIINQAIYNWCKKFEFSVQGFSRIDSSQATQLKDEAKRQLMAEIEKLVKLRS